MAVQTQNANLSANRFVPNIAGDNLSGMRMASPVVNAVSNLRVAKDTFSGARNFMNPGGRAGGLSGATRGMFGSAGGALKTFFGALKSNFMFSAILSGVTNLYELATGKVKPMKAAGNFIADTAAYTGIGAAATTIGGFVGSFLGPLGTIGGILVGGAVGLFLGKFYETNLRDKFSGTVQQSLQGLSARAQQASQQAPQT